jgi:deoxyribodipyrimidine photo-lyase
LHHPARLVKGDGSPYVVYTPFKKAWRALPWLGDPLPAPQRIPSPVLEGGLPAADLASHPSLELFPPGEIEALRRLEAFTAGISAPIFSYATQRSRLDLNATSALSPYFHLGLLSPRQAVAAGRGAASRACDHASLQGAETWLDELIWREFYHSLLYHFPRLNRSPFRDSLARIRWRNDPEEFAAWQAGQTGYPIIDAAMRQLEQTGWMHNRARMIVASFLVKDLLVDWRWGEAHFMSRLVDGDLAANSGGWQWTAGVGADAAPYFRIFNPFLQGIKFDPQGVFIRTYLPELASVPAEFIHHPWEMPHDVQRRAGCIVGANYPAPIVDHRQARQRALFAYHTSSIRETHV